MDEPNWSNPETVNTFNTVCAALSESWPGYHAVVPFYSEYFTTVQGFEGNIDILCPNQATFDPNVGGYSWAEERLQDFKTRNHTWRYQGDGQCGGIYGYISAIAPVGTMRRILFWQQYAINSDGFLNWNCALLPHDWTKKQLPTAGYTNDVYQTGNSCWRYSSSRCRWRRLWRRSNPTPRTNLQSTWFPTPISTHSGDGRCRLPSTSMCTTRSFKTSLCSTNTPTINSVSRER